MVFIRGAKLEISVNSLNVLFWPLFIDVVIPLLQSLVCRRDHYLSGFGFM
jgi:hypothetical protein